MRVVLLSLFFIVSVQSRECVDLFTQLANAVLGPDKYLHAVDWEVERFFPDVVIRNGHVPRGSRAFITWRQNTSPWIPDSAFLFHYLSPDDIARKLGFLVAEYVTVNGVEVSTRISPKAHDYVVRYFESLEKMIDFPINRGEIKPRAIAEAKYTTLENMWDELQINLRVYETKWKSLIENRSDDVRYLVDSDGHVYLWTTHESKTLYEETGISATHVSILELLMEGEPKNRVLAGFGKLDFSSGTPVLKDLDLPGYPNGIDGQFDFLEYIKLYFDHTKN